MQVEIVEIFYIKQSKLIACNCSSFWLTSENARWNSLEFYLRAVSPQYSKITTEAFLSWEEWHDNGRIIFGMENPATPFNISYRVGCASLSDTNAVSIHLKQLCYKFISALTRCFSQKDGKSIPTSISGNT